MNKSILAKELSISRATLYRRAKDIGIDLNSDISDAQKKQLKNSSSINSDTLTTKTSHKNVSSNTQSTETNFSDKYRDNETLLRQISEENKNLSEQLNKLFIQLENKDLQLLNAHENITNTQKLLNQSQQLQLDLQQQLSKSEQNRSELLIENKALSDNLTAEKKRSFWKTLFNID